MGNFQEVASKNWVKSFGIINWPKLRGNSFRHQRIRVHLSLSTIYKSDSETTDASIVSGNNNTLNLHSERLFWWLQSLKTIANLAESLDSPMNIAIRISMQRFANTFVRRIKS